MYKDAAHAFDTAKDNRPINANILSQLQAGILVEGQFSNYTIPVESEINEYGHRVEKFGEH